MLESLHVKNVALIDESQVNFGRGLNILTGETGAGKSMIIGSIHLALGGKGDKGLIRNGAEYALVQLVFHLEDPAALSRLKALDVYPDEENRLLLERRILPSKSVSKVNGEMIAAKTLRQVAEILIDIHGQHEHQSLLKKSSHFSFLDAFCEEKKGDLDKELELAYKRCRELKEELLHLYEQEKNREKELSFAQFELGEITQARLSAGEDEQLESLVRRMANARKIAEALAIAGEAVSGQGENASSLVERAYREIHAVAAYDPSLEDLDSQFAELEDLLYTLSHSIHDCEKDLEFDEKQFEEARSRLDLINLLKQKYARESGTIEEILQREQELTDEVAKLQDFETYLADKKQSYQKEKDRLIVLCEKVSAIRRQQAKALEERMQSALEDLNFLQVQFQIAIKSGEEYLSSKGYDDVEFLISLNPGEALRPLGEVASGGELSRVMLALKTVLADKDQMETLVFDEIDAGISGKTAWKVSEKMAVIGKNHQVICITHLPQIAAMADEHFMIEKESSNDSTQTQIRPLERPQMIEEIARLLGSDTITDTALQSAEELKKMADQAKQ